MTIIRSDDVRDLAQQVFFARGNNQPFGLFLGSGCARAAGVPDWNEMAMQFFTEELVDQRSFAKRYMSPEQLEDIRRDLNRGRGQLVESFFALLADLSPAGRYTVLQRFYSQIPVPDFYIEIARLIRDGYFQHVITTSIDDLLEKALASLGVTGRDYQLISLAGDTSRIQPFEPNTQANFLIVKLHGDLQQQRVVISPEEIEETLGRHRLFVKGELAGNMLMVGYNAESGPVEKWLTWTSGPLWWANPEPPDEQRRLPIEQRRPVVYITGVAAQPAHFFKSLSSVLSVLELDWLDSSQDPYEYLQSANVAISEPVPPTPTIEAAKGSDSIATYEQLQSQIETKHAILSELELQQFVAGAQDTLLKDNLDHTKQELAGLEDQLRELTYSETLVLDLMEQVRDSAAQNQVDAGVLAYFEAQNQVIEGEYLREQPSQDVLFAALSSISILAQRLGNSVIDSPLLDQLVQVTSIAGSEVGRRA